MTPEEAAQLRARLQDAERALAAKGDDRENVQLSMASDDHGSPVEYVELSRYALGEIELDPSSSSYWNHHTVKAKRFYDERMDFTKQPLYGRVHWNPPGGKTLYEGKSTSLPRVAWRRLFEHWRDGRVHSAVWIGYSLEQLTMLQGEIAHPLQFFTLVPRERLQFLKRPPGGGPPIKGEQPTHGNYITLLPTLHSGTVAKEQAQRFVEFASRLEVGGALVRPLV